MKIHIIVVVFNENAYYLEKKGVTVYERILNLPELLEKKSLFLFGPRLTGKTTLIKRCFKGARFYDLLNLETYTDLMKRPSLLVEEGTQDGEVVIIDEIQKMPSLLDEVHRLVENNGYKFLLSGSSARKLKRDGANLLAGRAWPIHLFPLTSAEIPHVDLLRYLNRGGLPQAYDSPHYQEDLRAYTALYLREEVQQEALVRNVRAFSEFLDLMALSNGKEINFEGLARDFQGSPGTLRNYIDILDDTLLGFKLHGYTKTKKRKAISRFKYYFFDIGVTNILCNRGEIKEKSELFGQVLEHFIILEVRAFLSYKRKHLKMFYWRSTSQFEVDIVLEDSLALEIKSSPFIQDKHLKGLRAFKEEAMVKNYAIVSLDKKRRKTTDGIVIYPWKEFLIALWNGEIL